MPRPLRIRFPDAVYHVTNRGNESQAIFADAADARAFMALLEKIAGDPDGPDLLDELQTEEHGSYLMNISDAAATHYRIAAGSEAVLALFEQPRSCCDVIDYLRDLSSVSSVEIDFFVELVDAGILVASSQPAVPSTQRSAALPNGIVDG